MALLGKKADKQWRFVGQEVTQLEDLTEEHIRAVYGLSPTTNNKHETMGNGSNEASNKSSSNSRFPYCGNHYTNLSSGNTQASREKSNSCSASRCKDGNPHCLNYMGQAQWESDDAFESYFAKVAVRQCPEPLKRQEDTPAGMKNLGATCYVNSLLQVWFHDLAFRDAIYRCRFQTNIDNSMNALYQLQLLFAHLNCGTKSYYNPQSLVTSLKLDTAMQQDAQDLFMAQIDNQFKKQADGQLGNFINNQFQGRYSYHTQCKNCKKISVRDCTFYELLLNIKDNCTLLDCLEEFIEPEELLGADQYSCSTCGSLQDATRRVRIDKLPPVLNVQLMRFVYDSATWTKKKSKDTIRFPETIDFSELLGTKENAIYNLTAVLVHSGPSAHSGHFLAHVLNKESNKWFVLNDEEVRQFHGTKFDPESYSESEANPTSKKTSARNKGTNDQKSQNILSSRNAYMLTYTRSTAKCQIEPCKPPREALDIVLRDNTDHGNEINKYEQYKETLKSEFEKVCGERKAIYSCWDVNSDQQGQCYIATEELIKFIQQERNTCLKLDNSSIICEHGKLCPKAFTKSKRISEAAKELLVNKHQVEIAPMLTIHDFCGNCIRNIVQDKLYRIVHRRDVDEFERKSRGIKSPTIAWVSKLWLAEWLKASPRFHPSNGTAADDPNPMADPYKADIICPHRRLTVDKSKRKLINKAALDVLERVFGALNLPSSDATECTTCLDNFQPHVENIKEMTAKASFEKTELSELIMRGARIRQMETGRNYYAVSTNYIKKPAINLQPTMIDNSSLLCAHGQFMYDLENSTDAENEGDLYVINEGEWIYLQTMYGGGTPILIRQIEAMDSDMKPETTLPVLKVEPSVCLACRNERILDFTSTTLLIRLHSSDENRSKDNRSGAVAPPSQTLAPPSLQRVPSPTVFLNDTQSKRKNMFSTTSNLGMGTRRSKRSKVTKKSYKEIKLQVSKWETIMELKLKIMQKTNIVPLYQKLMYNNTELDQNESTIAEQEILPNAALDLIPFDQGMDDLDFDNFQDVAATPADAGGFGGTGLTEEWF
ncbi:hypothetical protein BX616_007272 [Lobosporangium transversale]|nr:hypothetical protein BX616_007272 [Lobosporangium transversale]